MDEKAVYKHIMVFLISLAIILLVAGGLVDDNSYLAKIVDNVLIVNACFLGIVFSKTIS